MRIIGLLLTVLAIGFAVSANVPPLRIECPPDGMSVDACRDAVRATMRRGLPVPHPLILAARVEPARDARGYGHQATVMYDLLGMPSPTVVRLYYDIGGHWDGEADRGQWELGIWWAVPVIVLLGLGGWLVTRGRHRPPASTGP